MTSGYLKIWCTSSELDQIPKLTKKRGKKNIVSLSLSIFGKAEEKSK